MAATNGPAPVTEPHRLARLELFVDLFGVFAVLVTWCSWSADMVLMVRTPEVHSKEWYQPATVDSVESKVPDQDDGAIDLAALFSDLVRLETDVWNTVDCRLRTAHDLPLSWFEPMQVMDRTERCRVADIARALSITVGGTSKLVDRIEQAGWCARAPNPVDARSSVLTLTGPGRRLMRAAQASFENELEQRLGTAVTRRQLSQFAAFLRDLRRHISGRHGRDE